VNLIEIIEILPDKPIVNIKRSKENNKCTLYYDKEGKEQKTVTIDDLPITNDKSQLFNIQVELNRLKYKQLKQKIAEISRNVTNQLKMNSWRPESERIRIANNPGLNILHNAKEILYQWFSEQQINPSPLSGMPTIRLPENKSRKPDVTQIITDNTSPSIQYNGKYIEFKKEKDNIIITYNNRTRSYRADGFKYLYHLLYNPSTEIHSSKLYQIVHYQAYDIENDEIIEQQDNVENDELVVSTVDDKAQNEYREKLMLLKKGMDEAEKIEDIALYLKYEEEYEKLVEHVKTLYDKHGKPKKLNKKSDNHRRNVQRAMKTAFEKIEKDFPDIYKFLYSLIETGTFCRYNPNDGLNITVS